MRSEWGKQRGQGMEGKLRRREKEKMGKGKEKRLWNGT